MKAEEIKKKIAEKSAKSGMVLSEDELNAKVIELSEMDPDSLERVCGGHCSIFFGNCDKNHDCWSNEYCGLAVKL